MQQIANYRIEKGLGGAGFGVAKSLAQVDSRVGALPPAPHYLSPEQLKGHTTAFSDQ